MKKDLVSIIVLNWHAREVIMPCLESLFAQSYRSYELILVDNDSADGSLEEIKATFGDRIKIIENSKNLGFAGGVNAGIRQAEGEYIALLNSDAEAEKHWLAEMVQGINQRDSIGMCACKIYLYGREGIIENTGELISRDGQNRCRGRLEKDEGQYDQSQDVLCPSGCAVLYRRRMLDDIGLFDEKMFAYGEDMEIGLRGLMMGYEAVYIASAIVYHRLSASSAAVSPMKVFYVERNRLWIVLKCFPWQHVLLSFMHTALRYGYHLTGIFSQKGPAATFSRESSSFQLIWILLKSYCSNLFHLPYFFKQRYLLKKKSRWGFKEFENCFRRYGISARNAALSPVSEKDL